VDRELQRLLDEEAELKRCQLEKEMQLQCRKLALMETRKRAEEGRERALQRAEQRRIAETFEDAPFPETRADLQEMQAAVDGLRCTVKKSHIDGPPDFEHWLRKKNAADAQAKAAVAVAAGAQPHTAAALAAASVDELNYYAEDEAEKDTPIAREPSVSWWQHINRSLSLMPPSSPEEQATLAADPSQEFVWTYAQWHDCFTNIVASTKLTHIAVTKAVSNINGMNQ